MIVDLVVDVCMSEFEVCDNTIDIEYLVAREFGGRVY